jgi:drug/metabolite transporter (DMT)-like permease
MVGSVRQGAGRAERVRGYLLVVLAAVLFSVNAGVSRAVQNAGVGSGTLTTVRCSGTAIVLLAVVYARGERLFFPRSRQIWWVVAFGVTGVALVQFFYFVAIDRLPVGIALLLEFTAPILVALWVRFVSHEPVRRRMWLGLGLSLGGLALVAEVWSGLALDGLGIAAGLAAAGAFATYFLMGERSVTTAKPLHVMTQAFVVAAIFWNLLQPATTLLGTGLMSHRSLGGHLSSYHAPLLVLLLWIVVLGTVLPFLAELSALQYLSATEVGMVGMLEPLGATVVGWAWLGQSLAVAQVLGMVAILLGIGLAQTARVGKPPAGPTVTGV